MSGSTRLPLTLPWPSKGNAAGRDALPPPDRCGAHRPRLPARKIVWRAYPRAMHREYSSVCPGTRSAIALLVGTNDVGLASCRQADVVRIMREFRSPGGAVLFSTHSMAACRENLRRGDVSAADRIRGRSVPDLAQRFRPHAQEVVRRIDRAHGRGAVRLRVGGTVAGMGESRPLRWAAA